MSEISPSVNTISNPAKLLHALMKATGITCAATLSTSLDIPVRTIRRLKLEAATIADSANSATTANSAISGRPDTANAAMGGRSYREMPSRVEDNNKTTNLETTVEKIDTPKSPKLGKLEALEAFHAYNAVAERCALPQASKMTGTREKKIIARLKEFGLDGWAKALANIEKSSFLCGDTEAGFRADLDFVCQAKSFSKLHDGGYGNGRKPRLALPAGVPVPPPMSEAEREARRQAAYDRLIQSTIKAGQVHAPAASVQS
jgi:hypothetical protein